EQYVSRYMSDDYLGICDFEIADRQLFHSGTIYSFNEAAGSARADTNQTGNARTGSNRCLFVNECIGRTGVHDKPGRVSVERPFHIGVMIRISPDRDSPKSATHQETRKALTHCGTPSIWIHVKHLPGAIDNHSELDHLVRAKNAIDVRHGLGIGDM